MNQKLRHESNKFLKADFFSHTRITLSSCSSLIFMQKKQNHLGKKMPLNIWKLALFHAIWGRRHRSVDHVLTLQQWLKIVSLHGINLFEKLVQPIRQALTDRCLYALKVILDILSGIFGTVLYLLTWKQGLMVTIQIWLKDKLSDYTHVDELFF